MRIPAQAPATAFFEFGVRLLRSMFDGVDDGDGILVGKVIERPEEGIDGNGGGAANVRTT